MPRIFLFLTALFIASFSISDVRAAEAEITLRIHHFLGADSVPHKKIMMPWAARVEKQSGGRIKVDIYPELSLGGRSPDLITQVKSGIIDIIWTAAAYTPGLFPRTEVFTLPLVHQGNAAATNLGIIDMYREELEREFDGLHPLLIHVHQGHALHMAKATDAKLGELKGKVIRPPGRRIGRWSVEALGAQITKKRHPKLAKALKQGKLDGTLMSFHLASNMGVLNAAQSHILLGENRFFGTSLYLFLMNAGRYEALAPELRDVINRNSGRAFAREIGQLYQHEGERAMTAAKAQGHNIVSFESKTFSEVRQAMFKVMRSWAQDLEKRNIDGLQLIKKARKSIAHNTKAKK